MRSMQHGATVVEFVITKLMVWEIASSVKHCMHIKHTCQCAVEGHYTAAMKCTWK